MSGPDYYPEGPYQQRQMQMAASAGQPPGQQPPPVASFTYSPASPNRNQNVTFDASGSQAGYADAPITDYSWLFSDGTTADGVTATWMTSNKAGSYLIELTVTAGDGQTDTASQTIPVS